MDFVISKTEAQEVRRGDSIPGLDNGYVVEVDTEPQNRIQFFSGFQPVALNEEMTLITYHDANGEECYLLLPSDSLLTIERDK